MVKKKLIVLHVAEAFGGGVYHLIKDLVNSPLKEDCDFKILFGNREKLPDIKIKGDFPRCELIEWRHASRTINPLKDLLALKFAWSKFRMINPDIIHLHSSKAGVHGRISAKLLRKSSRVIYCPHGLSFLKLDDPLWKRKFYIFLERFASFLGGNVVGTCDSEIEVLNNQGIKALKIENGISPSPITAEKSPLSTFKVITVGRICTQKNPLLFDKIASSLPNIKFTWVGDGEDRRLLKSKNIEITGWISREKVSICLLESHLYLSTSLWEGLPLSVLEAMSLKLPLLLKKCVGNVDLVKNGNGYLFEHLGEAVKILKDLIQSPEVLTKMGEESLRLLRENYSFDEMIQEYRKLYFQLAENKDINDLGIKGFVSTDL